VPLLQFVRLLRDVAQHVDRRAARRWSARPGRVDAALQARHADHEELVEVRREDREEVGPFEHGDARILGEFEHAQVEGEPAELAVEVALGGQLGRTLDVEGLEVVVEVARGAVLRRGRRPSSQHHATGHLAEGEDRVNGS
jgi:hypothetical protein